MNLLYVFVKNEALQILPDCSHIIKWIKGSSLINYPPSGIEHIVRTMTAFYN